MGSAWCHGLNFSTGATMLFLGCAELLQYLSLSPALLPVHVSRARQALAMWFLSFQPRQYLSEMMLLAEAQKLCWYLLHQPQQGSVAGRHLRGMKAAGKNLQNALPSLLTLWVFFLIFQHPNLPSVFAWLEGTHSFFWGKKKKNLYLYVSIYLGVPLAVNCQDLWC